MALQVTQTQNSRNFFTSASLCAWKNFLRSTKFSSACHNNKKKFFSSEVLGSSVQQSLQIVPVTKPNSSVRATQWTESNRKPINSPRFSVSSWYRVNKERSATLFLENCEKIEVQRILGRLKLSGSLAHNGKPEISDTEGKWEPRKAIFNGNLVDLAEFKTLEVKLWTREGFEWKSSQFTPFSAIGGKFGYCKRSCKRF